jgi:hypothetical protein
MHDEERTRRIGMNEALFRKVNEQLEDLNRGLAQVSDETMHIVCECGDLECHAPLVVPISAYEEVRADPALFFVLEDHVESDVEDVVEKTPGYDVVRKHPGLPERIAEETDPR